MSTTNHKLNDHDTSTINSDEHALNLLGYKQELKRVFTPLEIFGVGFGIIGIVPSIASVLIFSLPNGGATALVWGWVVCAFFLMFIALAMAELGSAAPTIGGLYFWTYRFSPPKWRNYLSWLVGYSNTMGNLASVASVDWGCAVQIMAAVSIGSDFVFTPTVYQTYGVFVALLVTHGIFCSLGSTLIARMQTLYIIVNTCLVFVIIIGLPAATPSEFKNSATYAFTDFQNIYGWPNGFAFILSFLAPLWAIGAFDSTVHMSEEATNARVAVPYAMITACASAGIFGFGLLVAIAFNMGTDVPSIIGSPIGQPFATILFNSFGKNGTLVIWSFIIMAQFMMGTSMLTVCSRQMFAFARDGALPLSSFIYHINPRTTTPVNSVWIAAFCAACLGLLGFAPGSTAIGAVFALVVIGQYFAYSIPISARFLGGQEFTPGPFTLGKFGGPVAFIAVAWMLFTSVVFLFPAAPEFTSLTFNYTVVVFGGVLLLSSIYYAISGRHWFKGPINNVDLSDSRSAGSMEKVDIENSSNEKI